MKLNEVIAKYGNQEVDESKIKEVLGVKESKVWIPNEDEQCWFIYGHGVIDNICWNSKFDEKYYSYGNVYKTKEAEFARDKKLFEVKMERYLSEHEDEPVDWGNLRQTKYFVQFNHHRKSIETDFWDVHEVQGAIHTTSRKALEQFIKDNEADIKKYMFGVE